MKKTVILLSILMLTLASIIFLTAEQDPPYTHSWTKAICDENNHCQDHIIFCKGEKLVSTTPITGATVQLSKNWEDPRDEEIREKFC